MRQAVRVGRQILVPRIIECACLHPRRLSWQETLTLCPRFRNLFPSRYGFRSISKRICRHSHPRCILIQLLHIHLIKSVRGRMMIAKVEPRILRGTESGNAELDHTGDILGVTSSDLVRTLAPIGASAFATGARYLAASGAPKKLRPVGWSQPKSLSRAAM